jgi:DGQHR domain-containing protein
MPSNKLEFLPKIPAFKVEQGDFTFYVFHLSAKKLLSIAYTSERTQYNRTGIQRGLRRDRLRDIGAYLKGEKSGPPILPNTIIISLSNDSFFRDGHIHIANRLQGEAFILDGQHRLWAFDEKWCNDVDLELVVSAFIDLADKYKALIFRTINGEQRKINPSLVYDLIPMLRGENWVKFEDQRAHDLVEELNTHQDSPWKGQISMVGGGSQIISLSSFITAIKKLFKKGHIFDSADPDFFEASIQFELLLLFFKSLADIYSMEWNNKKFLLCKYVGVAATLNFLEMIIKDLRESNHPLTDKNGLIMTKKMMNPYLKKLSEYHFSAEEAKKAGLSYVGESGITQLTSRIRKIVFESESR